MSILPAALIVALALPASAERVESTILFDDTPTREETLKDCLRHAAELRIAVSLRKKHQVFVPDQKEILENIAVPKDSGWECITHPDGKTEKISRNWILKLIEEAEGILLQPAARQNSLTTPT